MSFNCWWCDETNQDNQKVTRSYRGVSDELFCPACARELDQWTEEKWEEHYDKLSFGDGGWVPAVPKVRRRCRVEGCDGIPEPDENYCDEHIREP